MIFRIIKVGVSVSRKLRLITLTETLTKKNTQKPNPIIALLYIVLKEIMTNTLLKKRIDEPFFFCYAQDATHYAPVNLALLLEIMHCACNLQIIH